MVFNHKRCCTLFVLTTILSLAVCSIVYIPPDLQNVSCTPTQQPCLTLLQLSEVTVYNASTKFVFLPGNHYLTRHLSVANIDYLSLSADSTQSCVVTVTCQLQGLFTFVSIDRLSIDGLTFIGCDGTRVSSVTNITISHANFQSQNAFSSNIELIDTSGTITQSYFFADSESHYGSSFASGGALKFMQSNVSVMECSFLSNVAQNGGAMYVGQGSRIFIESCVFNSNQAYTGGAIQIAGADDTTVSIVNSNFTNNTAEYGGSVDTHGSNVYIIGSNFHDNHAISDHPWTGYGGALNCYSTQLFLDNVNISDNSAAYVGGGLYIGYDCSVYIGGNSSLVKNSAEYGGGIYISNDCNVHISGNSSLVKNSAEYGGGIYSDSYNTLSITESRVINNNALYGGGVYCNWNILIVDQTLLSTNNATRGGGIYGYECNVTLNYNRFTMNTAITDGGAIFIGSGYVDIVLSTFVDNRVLYGRGGAIHTYRKLTRLTQCTLYNNTAAQCGAVRATRLEISECNIAHNKATGVDERDGGGALCIWDGYVRVSKSNFEHNIAKENGGVIETDRSNVSLHDSTFINNGADKNGGVIECDYCNITVTNSVFKLNIAFRCCGVFDSNYGNVSIHNSTFINNSAYRSHGVMELRHGSAVVSESTFQNNTAHVLGHTGVIGVDDVTLEVYNSSFVNNTSTRWANVIDITDGSIATISFSTFANNSAGGTFDVRDSVITIENCIFTNNTADSSGGVLAISNGSILISSCQLISNHASHSGGAIHVDERSSVSILDSVFSGNTAGNRGGAIECDDSQITLLGSSFMFNLAKSVGGMIYTRDSQTTIERCDVEHNIGADGGAVDVYRGNITISNVVFENNSATNWGGAISFDKATGIIYNSTFLNNSVFSVGGAVALREHSDVAVLASSFQRNTAINYGGSIATSNSVLNISDCSFIQNKAVNWGGVMALFGSSVLIQKSMFANNSVLSYGGAFKLRRCTVTVRDSSFEDNDATVSGGAMHIDNTNITLERIVFQKNSASKGGAINFDGDDVATLEHVSFLDNTATSYHGGSLTVICSNLTMQAVVFEDNSAINGGAFYVEGSSVVAVNGIEIVNNHALDRGGAIAIRRSTLIMQAVNLSYNNTANWGAIVSECNSTIIIITELENVLWMTDPIYTHCQTYDGNLVLSSDLSTGTQEESYEKTPYDVSVSTTTYTAVATVKDHEIKPRCKSPNKIAYVLALVIGTSIFLTLLGYFILSKARARYKVQLRSKQCAVEHQKSSRSANKSMTSTSSLSKDLRSFGSIQHIRNSHEKKLTEN